MTSDEFVYWEAFFRMSPPLQNKADYHAASIVQAIINSNPYRKSKKGTTLEECKVVFTKKKIFKKLPPDQLYMKMQQWMEGVKAQQKQ